MYMLLSTRRPFLAAPTVSPHGFPMLCCLCSSKKEDDIKPNGDDAKLRQSRREEMSKFWEHEHLLQINADANFNFPPTEAVLLLRQTQHWKPMRTPRTKDRFAPAIEHSCTPEQEASASLPLMPPGKHDCTNASPM